MDIFCQVEKKNTDILRAYIARLALLLRMLKVGLKEPAEFMVIPRYLYSLTFSSNLLSKKMNLFCSLCNFFNAFGLFCINIDSP